MSKQTKLLVLELWGLGDLMMAAPFLQAATRHYEVTLLAKDFAQAVVSGFFPTVKLVACTLPWTAFRQKYHLHTWPGHELRSLIGQLRDEKYDVAVSARWDPRDHLLLRLSGARRRVGFARLGSGCLLTDALPRPALTAHRYEYWRAVATALELDLPARENISPATKSGRVICVHTGASQPTKVWPLERYQRLVARLRGLNYQVQILCDPPQKPWWLAQGEATVCASETLAELIESLQPSRLFIGNDSGPGHLAALSGVPTFTIFGNQFPERFAPLHPAAEWIEGRPCAYKPCYDHCRFPAPHCLLDVTEDAVWSRVSVFVTKHLPHD